MACRQSPRPTACTARGSKVTTSLNRIAARAGLVAGSVVSHSPKCGVEVRGEPLLGDYHGRLVPPDISREPVGESRYVEVEGANGVEAGRVGLGTVRARSGQQ